MKKHFIYLILMVLSCTQSKKERDGAAFTNRDPTAKIMVNPSSGIAAKFSDLYDNITFIPLETTDENLVDAVEKIIFSNDKFFVLSSGSLLIFDSKGKFMSKINSRGLGPQEYRTLWDMHIDTLNEVVEVLDTPGRKIMTFDFKGNMKNVWRHNLIVESFAKMDSNKYLLYCGNNFNETTSDKLLYKTKNTQNIDAGYFAVDENEARYLHFKNNRIFSHYNDSIFFIDPFDNVVFSLDKNGPSPKLAIDFGEYELPKEILEDHYENAYLFSQQVRKKDYAFLINSFFQNDDIVFFAFEYGDGARFVYHYKKENITKVIDNIADDVNFNGLKISDLREYVPKALVQDRFLILLEPSIFIERMETIRQEVSDEEWKVYKELHPEIVNIYNTVEITDNPIICLAKAKSL